VDPKSLDNHFDAAFLGNLDFIVVIPSNLDFFIVVGILSNLNCCHSQQVGKAPSNHTVRPSNHTVRHSTQQSYSTAQLAPAVPLQHLPVSASLQSWLVACRHALGLLRLSGHT
jgi:hypothetical protein